MDLSHLTRPSILCQCSKCSSSLAACENEWAKVSNTYSAVAGWLSVDLNRISISSEKKQIPQSSELSFLRGRIVQEIMCRLCHQKLGAVAHMETELVLDAHLPFARFTDSYRAKPFWKLSKVSFREIISMRETQPIFKEGALPTLLFPQQKALTQFESTAGDAPVGPDGDVQNISVKQQIENQGMSLNRISSTVDELHDTMFDLKYAFTALRIELNASTAHRLQNVENHGGQEMLKIVLKELKGKADEIERLKLENESLKLRTKMLEDRNVGGPPTISYQLDDRTVTEIHSPGLLNWNGKRDWPESLTNGRHEQIANSLDGDDTALMDDTTLEQMSLPPLKIPLKPADNALDHSQQLHNANTERSDKVPGTRQDSGEPIAKRPRLLLAEDDSPPGNTTKEKKIRRPRGWRKSGTQTLTSDEPQTSVPTISVSQQDAPHDTTKRDANNTAEETGAIGNEKAPGSGRPQGRNRRRRSSVPSRAASRAASANPIVTRAVQKAQVQVHIEKGTQSDKEDTESVDINSTVVTVEPPEIQQEQSKENVVASSDQADSSKHKAKVIARDILAKLTMEREEAMATDG